MLGGYQTISLMDDNIYQKIVNSNSKAILVGDIVIDGVRKNSVYVPVTIAGGVVTFNAYGKQYTIGADNSITSVDHAQSEIYYFASLDDVPDDLPVGSFVAVPSDIVELTTTLLLDNTPSLTESENNALSRAFDNGLPFYIKADFDLGTGQRFNGITGMPIAFTMDNGELGVIKVIAITFVGNTLQFTNVVGTDYWNVAVIQNA